MNETIRPTIYQPIDLRVCDRTAPMGVDTIPTFSWKAIADGICRSQTAYQIVVTKGDTTLWDSGKVQDTHSLAIPYRGEALESAKRYTWSLTVWDEQGIPSEPVSAHFTTGLLTPADLEGVSFISHPDEPPYPTMPSFRKAFTVKEGLASAILFTSGLGVYEAFIDGDEVANLDQRGEEIPAVLKPGFTETMKRRFYNTTDVTWMLGVGESVLSAISTHGWWSDKAARNEGKKPGFWAKLILTYKDGTTDVIVTDESWKTATESKVVYADIYTGEVFDNRISHGWMLPGFDDSAWRTPVINTEFGGTLCAWMGSPILAREDLRLVALSVEIYRGAVGASEDAFGKINIVREPHCEESFTLLPGETAIIDFGQNFAGWEEISVEGDAGTTLTIEHGEMVNDKGGLKSRGNDGPEGSIYNENYRSAKATTVYTLSGSGEEIYYPACTFYGFRYIEITTTAPVVIHSAVGQPVTSADIDTGFMETTDEHVNQLISNIRWGMYSNYLSIPTDCPQRDERMGWTADTQVFTKAGAFLADSKSFMVKFMADMRDSQREDGALPGTAPKGTYNGGAWGGTGWADAGVIIPYTIYQHFGDVSVIADNWEMMQRYVDGFLGSRGKIGPCNIWGDWLAYESNDEQIQSILAVCFYAWDALMMKTMALVLGKKDEAEKYRALYEQEKAYFIEQYVNEKGEVIRGEQTICLYALYLDLLPDAASVEAVKAQLISNIESKGNRLQTGFLGTAIILPTLTKIGRSDLAYTLLLQHDNPSWLYSVDQGATTIWERWNSYTKDRGFGNVSMNSFNHYAYGAVAAWMFSTLAGIDSTPAVPGFKRIIIAPKPDRRIVAETDYTSPYGIISTESQWTDKGWEFECSIPANTRATIEIPAASIEDCMVEGKAVSELVMEIDGIAYIGMGDGVLIFEAGSGEYGFVTKVNE